MYIYICLFSASKGIQGGNFLVFGLDMVKLRYFDISSHKFVHPICTKKHTEDAAQGGQDQPQRHGTQTNMGLICSPRVLPGNFTRDDICFR